MLDGLGERRKEATASLNEGLWRVNAIDRDRVALSEIGDGEGVGFRIPRDLGAIETVGYAHGLQFHVELI